MIFARIASEKNENLVAYIVANSADLPAIRHFYLEHRKAKTEPFIRTRKIDAALFERYCRRFGIDAVEAHFLLEEAAEKENKGEF